MDRLTRIAKKITSSYFYYKYYFTNIGKNLDIYAGFYGFSNENIESFLTQVNNIKSELQYITDKLSKYGVIKEYETIDVDTNVIEFHFVFKKDINGNDADLINFLQQNGFKQN